MSLNFTQQTGEWLRGNGPVSEVVFSTRIRLARNLAGFPFVSKSNRRQCYEVIDRARSAITSGRLGDEVVWIDVANLPEDDRSLLVERHLISRQHAKGSHDEPRGVAIASDETFAIMVNEEDHLRLQVMRCGLQLAEAFDQIDHIDDVLESRMDFAYSGRLGYLTACPTNVGTAIRVSVMMHLPALRLTGEIEKVRRAARDMHLAVRGLFGEGSDALGDLYQVSNQTTLGRSEREVLDDFSRTIVPQIIAYEQRARQELLRQRPALLEDKVWRAWATLAHARVITTEETLSLLSHLRLGVHLNKIDTVGIRTINDLFLYAQPAHLKRITGCDSDPAARREARARFIRQRLGTR